jgi:VanZ family protein|tara:strand:+ start:1005 stop:1334 length:330 start_codon:yes stop_codon:yes gene_type:complete
MKYIKNFLLVIMCVVFFVGFTKGISLSVLELFTDKELHVIVFLTYPFITYFLLPKFKYKGLFLFVLFMSLTTIVEIIQLYFPYRTFSYADIKFSIAGCLVSFGLIGYFK